MKAITASVYHLQSTSSSFTAHSSGCSICQLVEVLALSIRGRRQNTFLFVKKLCLIRWLPFCAKQSCSLSIFISGSSSLEKRQIAGVIRFAGDQVRKMSFERNVTPLGMRELCGSHWPLIPAFNPPLTELWNIPQCSDQLVDSLNLRHWRLQYRWTAHRRNRKLFVHFLEAGNYLDLKVCKLGTMSSFY